VCAIHFFLAIGAPIVINPFVCLEGLAVCFFRFAG